MKKILITVLTFAFLFLSVKATEEPFIYKSVINDEKKIALTFDDGPHATQTIEILEVLENNDIKATFFIVGENAEAHPDILRQISEEGHEIGNHTYSHLQANKTNKEALLKDVEKNHKTIVEICERDVELFRPPGGHLNKRITEISALLGYKIVLWNIDTRDWTHCSAKEITENVIKNTRSGSIILFHDYVYKNSSTAEALKTLIPLLKKEGYTFVTVSELIECGKTADTNKQQ